VDRVVLVAGIATTAALIAWLARTGGYYLLPLWERPDSPFHRALRPSGSTGHLLGIVGTTLIVVGILLYSGRKRLPALQGRGPMRAWLHVHIYLCLAGPALVTLHSALKFGGLAAWSFWSMSIVAASGVIGRWLYQQFPRTIRGQEMSLAEVREEQAQVRTLLERMHTDAPAALASAEAFAARRVTWLQGVRGPLTLPRLAVDDLLRPLRIAGLRRRLVRGSGLPRKEVDVVVALVRSQVTAARRIAFLGLFRRLFSWWHVVHLVFFVAMFALLVLHVAAALFFGAGMST
jgi:hypothetical protein